MSLNPVSAVSSAQSKSPEETRELARRLGKELRPGCLVALNGDLGAGKTVFAQGLGEGIAVENSDNIRSPTFAIFDVHEGQRTMVHVDLYRIEDPEEIEALGILDLLADSVVVVEWFERAEGLLGEPDVVVSFQYGSDSPSERTIDITRSAR